MVDNTKPQATVEISIHRPTTFVIEHLSEILPDWSPQPFWVIILLQKTEFCLIGDTELIQQARDRYRKTFIEFALALKTLIEPNDFDVIDFDVIDPRTGSPLLSRAGALSHDDVAVIHELLGFPIVFGTCNAVEHPQWSLK